MSRASDPLGPSRPEPVTTIVGRVLKGLVIDYAGVLTEPRAGELFTTIDDLRGRGIRTALLSNAAGGGTAKARLGRWFDALIFSGEVGFAKPSPEVYLLTAERLGLAVAACAFVDDSHRNVEGAVAAGMTGVHHTSVEETLTELSALFAA